MESGFHLIIPSLKKDYGGWTNRNLASMMQVIEENTRLWSVDSVPLASLAIFDTPAIIRCDLHKCGRSATSFEIES